MSLIGGLSRLQVVSFLPSKRRLAGRVQVNSVGVSKRYVVYNRWTLQYVCSGKTSSDGTWESNGLPEAYTGEDFFVVYLDDTRSFNPVAFDYIAAEA